MSSSGETALQRKDPRVHHPHGDRLKGVCFPRSNDIDLRQTYGASRKIGKTSVPTGDTLPLTEAQPFTHREGVHQHQEYQPTHWPMPRGRSGKGNRTTADTVVTRQTKVIGAEKRTDAKRWKTPKATAKTEARRNRAQAWLRKNGSLI